VNVKLTPELKELVQSKVQSGRYESASEVVWEALRLMERRDEGRAAEIQELRNRMDKGLAEARRGESADGETFMQGILEDLDRGMDDRDASPDADRATGPSRHPGLLSGGSGRSGRAPGGRCLRSSG
jgi:antitoxin ParD1/3/4